LPLIRENRVRALVVSTPKRAVELPDVPTPEEVGLKGAESAIWFGVFVPAKTPRDIVERLNQEAQRAANQAAVRDKLSQQGIDPMPITPAEFDALIRKEIAESIALVKAANIKVN
jgi:tripartite-type tricarboxylate transporter receptor subunit TctC